MVVLGIDPGTLVCGWAVWKDDSVLVHGNINMRSSDDEPLVRSVIVTNALRYALDRLLETETIDAIAIENQYISRRTPSGIKIAHLVGMIVYMSYMYYNVIPVLLAPTMVYYNLPFKRSDFNSKNAFHKAVFNHVQEYYDVKLDTVDEAFAILIAKTAHDMLLAEKIVKTEVELTEGRVCILST